MLPLATEGQSIEELPRPWRLISLQAEARIKLYRKL